MFAEPWHVYDLGRDGWAVEFVEDRAEPLFARYRRLHVAHQKARSRRPNKPCPLAYYLMRFVQMAAGDQAHPIAPHQCHQPRARLRLDRPVAGIGFLGVVEKQRLVKKPGNRPTGRLRHDRVEPGVLRRLLRQAAVEQHGVEPDDAPTPGVLVDIFDPPVGAEMEMPAGQAFAVDRLTRVGGIADIVVARDRAPAHPQITQQPGGIDHVVVDLGPIDGDIAGMNDEIRALPGNPSRERRPVVGEMRLAPAQMRVGDLNYAHHPSPKWAARSVIRAKTREHPAATSRSAWPSGQWLPPQKPRTGMPAATAAATPMTLSSTTVQSAGCAPSCCAANRKRSGAGLPEATCMALNTCGSKKRNSPVSARRSRTRPRWPFEATQRAAVNAFSSVSTPGIGCSSRASAIAVCARIASKNPSGNARPYRVSTAAVKESRFLPKPRTKASLAVAGRSAAVRHSARMRAKMTSLSTRTPSQSKMTRFGTGRLFLAAPPVDKFRGDHASAGS